MPERVSVNRTTLDGEAFERATEAVAALAETPTLYGRVVAFSEDLRQWCQPEDEWEVDERATPVVVTIPSGVGSRLPEDRALLLRRARLHLRQGIERWQVEREVIDHGRQHAQARPEST